MNTVYLLLGSNIGDSSGHLSAAKKNIEKKIGTLVNASGIYKTAAWGDINQSPFLNQILIVETDLSAQQTIAHILSIEKEMGRIRSKKNAPRIIDIDILFFNNDIIRTPDLVVPHPEIQNRRFVLVPLKEISPYFIHPILQKTPAELLNECADKLNVQKI